jgi:hypothetical protein
MHRWGEEVMLVGYEMVWTIRHFAHNMEVWEQRGKDGEHPGATAYAARKAAMWGGMAADADRAFAMVNNSYSRQYRM